MKLSRAVDLYIEHKRDLGFKLVSQSGILRRFCRVLGDIDVDEVSKTAVNEFIRGDGPVTSNLHKRANAVRGLYRYLLTRELVASSPMPSFLPKEPPPQEPHIYSHAELRDLLEAASRQKESWLIEPTTMRTLLLLLYGAALRAGESIRLALADVDIDQRLLVIRDTKFHKSRLVPLGTHLLGAINIYKKSRVQRFDVGPNAPFLITRRGHALNLQLAESNFVRLYGSIGMRRSKGNHYGPRLHDFRHTFAVHRLIRWYREGADVQRMLPHLSTYLGHVELRDTQRYLTMIPELLSEASLRFEKYTFTRKKAL